YQEGLRVVVSTANFIHCDCTAKTQGIWHQDFPWKDAASPSSSDFEASLTDYLAAMQLPLPWRYRVAKVVAQADMSSARAFLVPSVP
ncbi:tyrosyl-DNA phosphodiesterase, partial [Haematococcus lacustris]